MHVLVAPDKFRGTATAPEVCAAVARALPDHDVVALPLADGGEGTLDAFGGANRVSVVTGPLGTPVSALWRLGTDGVAVLECAQAAGLLVAGGAEGNDPVAATTRGVGELLLAAAAAGARRVLLGVGGSATTDGGAGALAALDGVLPLPVTVCCDVETRFTDAAGVFGPQKGASAETVQRLSARLRELRESYLEGTGVDVDDLPGSGAAGGLAGGLAAHGATLVPGFAEIARAVGLDAALAACDLVVTGEGRLDATSFRGKVVGGVLERARALGTPVLVVVGTSEVDEPVGVRVLDLSALYGADAALGDTAACIRRAVEAYVNEQRAPG